MNEENVMEEDNRLTLKRYKYLLMDTDIWDVFLKGKD